MYYLSSLEGKKAHLLQQNSPYQWELRDLHLYLFYHVLQIILSAWPHRHTSLTSLHTSSSSKTPGGIFCSRPPRQHCTLFSLLIIILKRPWVKKKDSHQRVPGFINQRSPAASWDDYSRQELNKQRIFISWASPFLFTFFFYCKYLDTTFHL